MRRPQALRAPLAGLALAGCNGLPAWATLTPGPAANDVVAVVYLVGDAGEADPRGEPVLNAVERDIAESPEGATRLLLFLGDNIYPRGLPAPGSFHIERGGGVRLSIVQVVRAAGRREVYATFLDENE